MSVSLSPTRSVRLQVGPTELAALRLSEADVEELAHSRSAGDALKLVVSRLDRVQADMLAKFLESEGVVVLVQQGPVSRAFTLRSPLRGDEIDPKGEEEILIGVSKTMRGGARANAETG